MGEQQLIPALKRSKPESGGKIDANLPFLRVHGQFARTSSARRGLHGVSPSLFIV
jgi:hypothetical protein